MNIKINQNIELKAISLDHANEIYNLVEENRAHLKLWLPFVENVHSVQFIENYIRGSIQRNLDGVEHAFTIFDRKNVWDELEFTELIVPIKSENLGIGCQKIIKEKESSRNLVKH